MIVWRAETEITVRVQEGKYGTHEGGRGLAAVISGWGGGRDFLLMGVYGVSNPRERREEADEVWKWGSRAIGHYRSKPSRADGRVVALGDFNAVLEPTRDRGAIADQNRRQKEEGDRGLAFFVQNNGLRDVAELQRNPNGEAFAFTYRARGGNGGESRLDRVYVGGMGSEEAVVESGGRAREPHFEGTTTHGAAWCVLTGMMGEGNRGARRRRPPTSESRRAAVSGAGNFSHRRCAGYPTRLVSPEGVEVRDEHTITAWAMAAGLQLDGNLAPGGRVTRGEAARRLSDWAEAGAHAGMISEAGRDAARSEGGLWSVAGGKCLCVSVQPEGK